MSNGERTEEDLDSEFTDEIDLEDEEQERAAAVDENDDDDDDDDDDDEEEHVPVNTRNQELVLRVEQSESPGKRKSKRRQSTIQHERQDELDELIAELDPGASSNVYLTITRVEPKTFKGRKITGYIDRIDRHISLQEIKELYGGGTYDIRFMGPKKKRDGTLAGNKFLTSRRVEVTGDPIIQIDRDDDDGRRSFSNHDPDIVSQAMKAQQNVVDRLEAKSKDEKETIMTLLGKRGDGESNAMILKILDVQEKRAEAAARAAEAQLAAQKEEARFEREEARRKEEKREQELKELRKEMEDRKTSTGDTMISFLREQSGENMKRMELTMKSISDINKSNMEMMANNHKMQTELLTNELKRVSDELKDSRLSNKSDLVSEMKRMSTLQSIMREITGIGNEEKTITDKISDNLPEILEAVPGIIQGIGGLFRGQQRVVQQQIPRHQMTGVGGASAVPRRLLPNANHQAPLPPRRPVQPSSFPVSRELESDEVVGQPAAPRAQPQVSNKQVEIAKEIAKLKISFEKSLEEGEAATTCYQNHIEGKYDEELLRKIAAMPASTIIAFLQQNLDDDSSLFTVKGKDFLRKIHGIIKERMG